MDQAQRFADKYELLTLLSKEDSGDRHLAMDDSGKKFIIKILPAQLTADADLLSRFLREAELACTIAHPGILRTVETGENTDGSYFLVTEYEEGITLRQFIQDNGPLAEKDALQFFNPVVSALDHVWRQHQLLHRSICPDSLLLTDANEIKITDFGTAKSLDIGASMDLTAAGFSVVDPDYMSPEQAEGEESIDFRSDMYALGIVLFETIAGKHPFHDAGSSIAMLSKHMNTLIPDIREFTPAVSAECITLLNKLCAKSPDNRFQSWDECIQAFLQAEQAEISLGDNDATFNMGAAVLGDEASSGIIQDEKLVPEGDLEPGTIIGSGFEVDRKVGRSRLGDIYLAFREDDSSLAQIKVLPKDVASDEERLQRFLREMKITSQLQHPNLLSVIETGKQNGMHFVITQYEHGLDLKHHIGANAPFDEQKAAAMILPIAEVLSYAWNEKKLIHRDIKPENVLINETGSAKLLDFGIAKEMEASDNMDLTGAGFTVGTPEYMSPEQVLGEENIDFRSDQYALGLTLYECLTGQKAIQGDNPMKIMQMQMQEDPTPVQSINPAISDSMANLVKTMLKKDPMQRYSSWDQALQQLRDIVAGKTTKTAAKNPSTEKEKTPAAVTKSPTETRAPSTEKKGCLGLFIFAGISLGGIGKAAYEILIG